MNQDGFERYAIYYAPEPGSALARLGAAWLGYDAAAGAAVARPQLAGGDADPAMVASPARYGFHATLKAPFRLADGVDAGALQSALSDFAATTPRARFDAGRLEVSVHHGFVALTPLVQADAFRDAVFEIVTRFEDFRAPLSEGDLARRRAAGLSAEEEANLTRYGYPYVGRLFGFHMTLTGRLEPEAAERNRRALADYFAPALDAPLVFDALSLFGDPGDGALFRVVSRHRFAA